MDTPNQYTTNTLIPPINTGRTNELNIEKNTLIPPINTEQVH